MSPLCTLQHPPQQLEDGHPPTIGPHLVCAEDSGSGSAGPSDTDPSNNHFLVVYTLLSSTGMDASAEPGPAVSETATKAAQVLSIDTVRRVHAAAAERRIDRPEEPPIPFSPVRLKGGRFSARFSCCNLFVVIFSSPTN